MNPKTSNPSFSDVAQEQSCQRIPHPHAWSRTPDDACHQLPRSRQSTRFELNPPQSSPGDLEQILGAFADLLQ